MPYKGIRSAVSSYNHHYGRSVVYLDTKTAEVWTKTYTGTGDETRYNSLDIVYVTGKGKSIWTNDERITSNILQTLCDAARIQHEQERKAWGTWEASLAW